MGYKQLAGERIKKAREDKGLSRPQLAARIEGLEASTLGNWEQGTRYPNDMESFTSLSKELDEPASYLAAIDDDPELISLIRMFSKMDRRGKDTVKRLAEVQPGLGPDAEDKAV